MSASARPQTDPSPGRTNGTRSREALAAEERMLLLTAGPRENDSAIREIADGDIDWPRFLALAQVERAVPVVYPRLRAIVADVIPGTVLDQMRRLALVSDFAMLHLEARLKESLRALEPEHVRVMLLKGAALANSAYSGVRERPMSDLDILVDPSNARLARRLMLGGGWRDIVGGIPDHVYERHHHLPPLCDVRSADLQLEIHTALFPERQPFAFDARDLWDRARPLGSFAGVFVPDPIHLLLHACLHFVWSHQGRFGVWRMIRDVDALARKDDLDWDAFVAVARSSRGATSCYWTFRIAELTGGVRAPSYVMEQLRPPRSGYLLAAVERHFVRNLFPVEFACPSVTLDHALWELAVMPGWSGHGEVRPWDEEGDFVAPSRGGQAPAMHKRERFRRLFASSTYIRTLLRPRA